MSDVIQAIEETRKTGADILAATVAGIYGKTEAVARDEILAGLGQRPGLFPKGWYDPPPGGVAVLSAEAPYERLQFETLRSEKYWPSEKVTIGTESVTMVYISPVDRRTGMLGDIGLTLYAGEDNMVREHIRSCRDLLVEAAEAIKVGMKFSDVWRASGELFEKKGQKMIGWMTTYHDPLKINLGHTVPGSYGDGSVLGDTFESTREAIRSRRIYFNEQESFVIPETCAVTLEVRLTDKEKKLPNTFFHVIVIFSKGERRVLTNFDDIFRASGMDYML